VSRDVERIIDLGLTYISSGSPVAKLVADVRGWRKRYPDWREAREAIESHYGYDKYPGNCHVIPNHALMIMALLYAPDDFARAQTIVCTSGWDTDCNAGNVGCFMGAMLGLEGIDAGRIWRGPFADRMLISSADGGSAINDAVRVSSRLVGLGRKLANLPELDAPKNGAQFHFCFPGSVQGFALGSQSPATFELSNIPFETSRALKLSFTGLGLEPVIATTPTFASPEVTRMQTYDLMATPLIYSGQRVQARVVADSQNTCEITVTLTALVYRLADGLASVESEPVRLASSEDKILNWRLPDSGGQPLQSVGIAVRSCGGAQDGAVILDWLRCDGHPDIRLRRPDEPSDFWRRAWVNAVDTFSTSFPQAFRISQDRGEGMIIHGGRQWRDYRLETTLTAHLAEHAGVGVRVQGLRRYYAVLLARPGVLRLVRVRDANMTVLAETSFEWSFERPYRFIVEAVGRTIEAVVDGVRLAARDDNEATLADGGIALIIQGGAASSNEVLVAPPQLSSREVSEVGAPELSTRLERTHGRR
jgi:hypothetical protein